MNYTKTSPVGIDIKMNLLQAKLHAMLLADLSLSTGQVDVYGRCYKLQEEEGSKPAKFITKEVERSIFSNDKAIVCWFYQKDDVMGD